MQKPQTYTNTLEVEKHINTEYDTVKIVADAITDGTIAEVATAKEDTAADVVSTNADVVTTNANAAATAADLIATNQDTLDTAINLVATNQDTIDTAADVVSTSANVTSTNADVTSTNANAVSTAADVVLTNADVTYADEWATKAEDSLISAAAGGNGTTDYSARHHANKAAASAASGADLATTVAGTDTYTATLGIGEYTINKTYFLKDVNSNLTTIPTINFDTLGAKTIKNMDGSILNIGELPSKPLLQYDGTDMLLLNPIAIIDQGFIHGLTLVNGTDAGHDINIAVGECTSSNKTLLELTTILVKQIDVTWASGGAAGGQAPTTTETGIFTTVATAVTGVSSLFLTEFAVGDVLYSSSNTEARRITTIASDLAMTLDSVFTADVTVAENVQKNGLAPDTWYHVMLIQKDSDGTTDAYFDVDIGATNIPAGYTAYKWIGAVLTDASANILPFSHDPQHPDYFSWTTIAVDVNANNPGTASVLRTLSVPTGIKIMVKLNYGLENTDGATITSSSCKDPALTDVAPALVNGDLATGYNGYQSGAARQQFVNMDVLTNTSGQVRTRTNYSSANVTQYIGTIGWLVKRGTV